jgi:hypothetical protein
MIVNTEIGSIVIEIPCMKRITAAMIPIFALVAFIALCSVFISENFEFVFPYINKTVCFNVTLYEFRTTFNVWANKNISIT